MVKFIEIQTSNYRSTLLNINKVEFFFANGEDVYIQFNEGMTRIESLDWETLKSMLGDNLIKLPKD